MLPLSGVSVIAVEQYGAGPFGSMLLGDLGAEVIKIENPAEGGDIGRAVGPYYFGPGDSHFFQAFNRNKRSLTLNLKHPEARRVFHELVRSADATLDNLRGDQPERLGVTYDVLSQVNPKIVCAHLSAYGREGPRKAWPGSQRLAVMVRNAGLALWSVSARSGFRNNGICVGNGRLFAIDRPASDRFDSGKRRGESDATTPRLVALDLRTGRKRWSTTKEVFGTWLSYSVEHDVLVEAGRNARDTLSDEPRGMRAFRADTGKVLWHQPSYLGPARIRGDVILKDQRACELLTGTPWKKPDPLTGEPVEWKWTRTYGCNTPAAAEHLLTFRSGAAGYYDLAGDGGTGNFGGFRSSCTHNLVVAGGLITAPDYTRTCTCSYQNQSSIALVPMPDAEMWTFYGAGSVKGPVRQVGIKLGAPGSRRAENGTVWQEFPAVGGPTPRVNVTTVPARPDYFRRHSAEVEGDVPHWIAASGARNLRTLTVALAPDASKERRYTVRLYFCEPDNVEDGQRLFNVAVQGKPFLTDFDVRAEAGGPLRGVMKELTGVKVRKDLTIALTPGASATLKVPVLSGVEVIAEGW